MESHSWVKFAFCVVPQWPHTLFNARVGVILFLCNFNCLSCLFPLGFSCIVVRLCWGGGGSSGGGYNQSLCGLVTWRIMRGAFLISAGLLHATQHDLSKTLLCHLVSLGNESQFELVNSGLYLRKSGNIGWLRGKTLGVRQTWIWTSVLHLTGCVAYSQSVL